MRLQKVSRLMNLMLCSEKVYTLADLKNWERREPSFAVLGKPIAHSLSPKMHNAAFNALRERKPQFADCRYFRFEIAPEELADALPLFFEKNFLYQSSFSRSSSGNEGSL